MLETNSTPTHHCKPPTWPANYTICVQGHLDPRWSEWLDGLTITHLESCQTLIYGTIVDQAELHSILTKVCNLNLEIISVAKKENNDEESR